jgi:gas vesicle protein
VVSRADRKAKKAAEKAKKRRGGFIIGALIGGVVALLAAPKTGKETREQLKSAVGGDGGFDFKKQADRLKDAVGAGKESAADQSEALKRKIEETRARLREQMDEGE